MNLNGLQAMLLYMVFIGINAAVSIRAQMSSDSSIQGRPDIV
ncbi:hypothetical protein SOVF_214510, partial [Spinacia oleracea]